MRLQRNYRALRDGKQDFLNADDSLRVSEMERIACMFSVNSDVVEVQLPEGSRLSANHDFDTNLELWDTVRVNGVVSVIAVQHREQ